MRGPIQFNFSFLLRLSFLSLFLVWGCATAAGQEQTDGAASKATTTKRTTSGGSGSSKCRLVAIGDIHGDLANAVKALSLAGILDASTREWVGGCATLVQTGDIVDRGADSLGAINFFLDLKTQAAGHGGRVVMLLGNHELLNFEGTTLYANMEEMSRIGGPEAWANLFGPNGEFRRKLQQHPIIEKIEGTIFVHAGITPAYAALGISTINTVAHDHIRRNQFNTDVLSNDGPTWTRRVIFDARAGDCMLLDVSLQLLGAKRMVVGHSIEPSKRIGSYCDGKLVALDVGMSRVIHNRPACVELFGDMTARMFYG